MVSEETEACNFSQRRVRLLRDVGASHGDTISVGSTAAQRDGRDAGLDKDEVFWMTLGRLKKAKSLPDENANHVVAGSVACAMLVVLLREAENDVNSSNEARLKVLVQPLVENDQR